MNRKKLKKLDLHAETLRQLENPELEQAEGGATGTRPCSFCTNVCSVCLPCA